MAGSHRISEGSSIVRARWKKTDTNLHVNERTRGRGEDLPRRSNPSRIIIPRRGKDAAKQVKYEIMDTPRARVPIELIESPRPTPPLSLRRPVILEFMKEPGESIYPAGRAMTNAAACPGNRPAKSSFCLEFRAYENGEPR